jgi:hypothetical protein
MAALQLSPELATGFQFLAVLVWRPADTASGGPMAIHMNEYLEDLATRVLPTLRAELKRLEADHSAQGTARKRRTTDNTGDRIATLKEAIHTYEQLLAAYTDH